MRRWWRRRRERVERIETEADELARLLGDDAYSEARWREHTASSPASAQEWDLIALWGKVEPALRGRRRFSFTHRTKVFAGGTIRKIHV